MAEVDAIHANQQPEITEENVQKLKYLDFVEVAALHVVGCASNFYDCAKEKSGPLKPGVHTVEGTVKTVVGPVCEKFHDVPYEILSFVDRKVDQSVSECDRRIRPLMKEASNKAVTAAQKAPKVACAVASKVRQTGIVETATGLAKTVYTKCEPTTKELYGKYEPVVEQYAVSTWHTLNRLPLFPRVAQVVVPTAAYCSEKYNQAVYYTGEKGYTVSSYLPLVPTEKIAEVFGDKVSRSDAPAPSVTTAGDAMQ